MESATLGQEPDNALPFNSVSTSRTLRPGPFRFGQPSALLTAPPAGNCLRTLPMKGSIRGRYFTTCSEVLKTNSGKSYSIPDRHRTPQARLTKPHHWKVFPITKNRNNIFRYRIPAQIGAIPCDLHLMFRSREWPEASAPFFSPSIAKIVGKTGI